jgi:hypothetical protein
MNAPATASREPARPTETAAPSAAAGPSRYDGYLGIHKALRLFMSNTLTRIGSTDPGDAAQVASTLAQTRELLELCELHVHDENRFLHPALERARPGSSARIAQEHVHHLESIHDLGDLAGLVADTGDAARATALARLYRSMALFVAENFVHMDVEETEHNALLWAHYSDAELIAIERELVASLPPQAVARSLYWFMPGLNAPERAAMLQGMKSGMPPEAFLGVLDIARRTLTAADYDKLAAAVSVPVATPTD